MQCGFNDFDAVLSKLHAREESFLMSSGLRGIAQPKTQVTKTSVFFSFNYQKLSLQWNSMALYKIKSYL